VSDDQHAKKSSGEVIDTKRTSCRAIYVSLKNFVRYFKMSVDRYFIAEELLTEFQVINNSTYSGSSSFEGNVEASAPV
jgi:hypothetical protein